MTTTELAVGLYKGCGIPLLKSLACQPGPTFLHLHANEATAFEVTREMVERCGGRLLSLRTQNHQDRLVAFPGSGIHFDPNRIFSEEGIHDTLREYNHPCDVGDELIRAIGILAKDILQLALLQPGQLSPLVAVHNNCGGDYSISCYRAGGVFREFVADYHLGEPHAPYEFFLTTSHRVYGFLRAQEFNVVLLNGIDQPGSLSAYCLQHGVPYVNIEAKEGNAHAQRRMLLAIFAAVQPYAPDVLLK